MLRSAGDPHGSPVFYHHGTPSSAQSAAFADEAAERNGVHLLSFDRPGYGDTPVDPPSLSSVGLDTVRLADSLGIDRFATVGVSGGGPYALATAIAAPERVSRVAVVAGIAPWRLIDGGPNDPREIEWLDRADAGDLDTALAGFRAAIEADIGDLLSIEDDEALTDAYLEGAPAHDLSWLTPEKRRVWAADLRVGLRGYDGYARDNVAWGGRWDIEIGDVRCPVHLYYGEKDRLVPPSHGRWLADRLPDHTLVSFPGAGHATAAYTYWDLIFQALV